MSKNTQAANERVIKDLKDKIIIRNNVIKDVKRQLCDCIKYIMMSNSIDAETFPINWCFNSQSDTDKSLKQELINIKTQEFDHHFIKSVNGRIVKISMFKPDLPDLISIKCTNAEILKRLERLEEKQIIEKQLMGCWILKAMEDEFIEEIQKPSDDNGDLEL